MKPFLVLLILCLVVSAIYLIITDQDREDKKEQMKREALVNYEKLAKETFITFADLLRRGEYKHLKEVCEESFIQKIVLIKNNIPFTVLNENFIEQNDKEIKAEFVSITVDGEYLKDIVVFNKDKKLKIRSINESIC